MYRATAFYGRLAISVVVMGADIESATINAEIAFADASMLVVEPLI